MCVCLCVCGVKDVNGTEQKRSSFLSTKYNIKSHDIFHCQHAT